MKKSLLFALMAVAMLGACSDAEKAQQKSGEVTASDVTDVRTVECVASGDVVYVHLDSVLNLSKLYATEGTALQTKVQTFQQKAATAQQGWASQEQALANEYSKLQSDAAKLEADYSRGLITTLNAQQKQEELQTKGNSIQSRMTALQNTVQTEGASLQAEEQALAEEQVVLMNRFQTITRQALDDINADKRYKMIVNAVSVIDADPTLNISDLILRKVDELYEAGALE
jgi:outer membrane protein